MAETGTAAVAPATETLALELRTALGQFRRKLREHGGIGDFTVSQMEVLAHLDRQGPTTVTALAALEGIRPQSMSATIAGLKEQGLVSGAPDPTDGRQTVLSLTDKCREAVKTARAAKQDWLARTIESRLDAGERARLADAVALINRLLAP